MKFRCELFQVVRQRFFVSGRSRIAMCVYVAGVQTCALPISGHAGVHHVAEAAADRRVLLQAPVVEHPGDVAVDGDRLGLIDDEGTVQTTADLFEASLVRVVPEGAGVDGVDLVDEALTGRAGVRSDERRVGKECGSTCRSRWAPMH